jgi:thiamine biosynthesis lipoprotein
MRATAVPSVTREAFRVFGTTATLLVTDAAAMPAARELADAELAAVDLACSRFRPDSELTKVNNADGATVGISPLLAELIGEALRAARLTSGDVDPTCATALAALGYDRDFDEVKARARRGSRGKAASAAGGLDAPAGRVPGWRKVELSTDPPQVTLAGGAQLDLGATAKAWAADRSAARIAARTGGGVLVSLGGDIAVAGQAPAGDWRVRVQDVTGAPEDPPAGPYAQIAIRDGGLATSSTAARRWRRGGDVLHHILDPRTGLPAEPVWRTVSVAAATCADANTASTAAIIRGRRALGWLAGLGLPARLVDATGAVFTVAGWPDESQAADESEATQNLPAGSADRGRRAWMT